MDKIINKALKKSLTDTDIKKIIKFPILTYNELKDYDDISQIGDAFMLLYPMQSANNGHWTCCIRHNNIIELYDPLGFQIDDQLKYSSVKYPKYLTELILRSKNIKKVVCNLTPVQEQSPNISSCGRHCICRLLCHKMSLAKYADLFKNQKLTGDEIVTYLTLFI